MTERLHLLRLSFGKSGFPRGNPGGTQTFILRAPPGVGDRAEGQAVTELGAVPALSLVDAGDTSSFLT